MTIGDRLAYAMLLLALTPLPSSAAENQDMLIHTVALNSIAPENRQFDDLAAFGRAVGDAQVVVLGEQTHGEGDVYSLKTRLIEYLHEKKGFDVLVMESGLFDGQTIGQMSKAGGNTLDLGPGNLFYVYSKTRQARTVFKYIDAQRKAGTPIEFASFDSQHSGKLSQEFLVDRLAAFLTADGSVLPQSDEWKIFRERTASLLKFSREAPPAAVQESYFRTVAQIDQCLSVTDKAALLEQAAFWRRVTASINSQARRFWTTGGDFVADINQREEASADNVLWLMQQVYPGRKLIVWTHDVHGQKAPLYGNLKGTMQRVRERLPQTHFYHVYFTAYNGQFTDFESGAAIDIGAHNAQSLEAKLHAAGVKAGFVDLWPDGKPLHGLLLDGYDRGFPMNRPELADFVDGVFYVDTMHPTVREQGFEN